MIGALKALFEMPQRESEEARQHRLNVAAAAMLIETARADFTQDADEQEAMEALLRSSLGLSDEEVHSLMVAAHCTPVSMLLSMAQVQAGRGEDRRRAEWRSWRPPC